MYDLCNVNHVTLHNNNNQSGWRWTHKYITQPNQQENPPNSDHTTPFSPQLPHPLLPPGWVAAALLFPWLATALLLLLLPRSLEAGARWCEVTWRPAAGLRSGPAPALRQLRPIDSLPHHTRPLRLSPTIPTKMNCTHRHICVNQYFG